MTSEGAKASSPCVSDRASPVRLARLPALGLVLMSGIAAGPGLATPDAAAGLAVEAAPRIRGALPVPETDPDARCEPDMPDHWALYRRIAARRLPESRATKTDSGARAE